MNSQRTSASKRGFTLMELMVAMAITTIIVTVLVSITSIALDTWNRSRSEIRASRQAKAMIDVLARDLEALVIRRGNVNEWFSAVVDPNLDKIGGNLTSTNAYKLLFFTAATDRYNGDIGKSADKGGDVSCVDYRLEYKDPMGSSKEEFKTLVLSRFLVNPDLAFKDLLGATDVTELINPTTDPIIDPPLPIVTLRDAISKTAYSGNVEMPESFICENIYQFSFSFVVETGASTSTKLITIPRTNPSADGLSVTGGGIVLTKKNILTNKNEAVTDDVDGTTRGEILGGRLTAIQISVTVISDFAVDQIKRRSFANDTAKADFLAKNSYQYAKLVQLPSM